MSKNSNYKFSGGLLCEKVMYNGFLRSSRHRRICSASLRLRMRLHGQQGLSWLEVCPCNLGTSKIQGTHCTEEGSISSSRN